MVEAKKGFQAKVKNAPMSPTKIRPIAKLIKLKPYEEALAILDAMPNKGAKLLYKVIQQAASNALYNNDELDEEKLIVKTILIDQGQTWKRLWPRSRGRADRLIRRRSHIHIVLDDSTGAKED